ncbi:hypothetical protein [Burkholderia pseudomallei]|uniref:hypothetical protein n=1 Tax=Burkholderia pseudomallei TaxID=28450 RepID=UPI0027DF3673|nr:hypothetical protein [Burkholderia pseudomallei]
MEHQFTLRFRLGPADGNRDDIIERLGAAGCTDALVGIGAAGHVSLAFSREAASLEKAIQEAIANVKAALPGAELIAVELESPTGPRLGVAKGRFEVPEDIDAHNDEVAELFYGSSTETVGACSAPEDPLLTIAEAATSLGASRPYASMLADAGKLGEVIVAEDGRRCVRAVAVAAYLATQNQLTDDAPSPRQAGMDAGLYDHPEGGHRKPSS